ncbi:hypothetical protein BLNAU_7762 [Blattamonas nauphoetae]|uniref:Uncharacterized protein n=1 Tax=Blattamonas nauphoetae TaxID=2049346 RepID=A0ABQ9Y0A0_9EUKA|nr:hypothetical protein BLNAU_7762 [Blattamonas nauphoetae]
MLLCILVSSFVSYSSALDRTDCLMKDILAGQMNQQHNLLEDVFPHDESAKMKSLPAQMDLDGIFTSSDLKIENSRVTMKGHNTRTIILPNSSDQKSLSLFHLTNSTLLFQDITFSLLTEGYGIEKGWPQSELRQSVWCAKMEGSSLSTDRCMFILSGRENLFVLSSPGPEATNPPNSVVLHSCSFHTKDGILSPFCQIDPECSLSSHNDIAVVSCRLSDLQVASSSGLAVSSSSCRRLSMSTTLSWLSLRNLSRTVGSVECGMGCEVSKESVLGSELDGVEDGLYGTVTKPLCTKHPFMSMNTSFTNIRNSEEHEHNPTNLTHVGQTYDANQASNRFGRVDLEAPVSFIECSITSTTPTINMNFIHLTNHADDLTIKSCTFQVNTTSSVFVRLINWQPAIGSFPTLTIDKLNSEYSATDKGTNPQSVIYVSRSVTAHITNSNFTSTDGCSAARPLLFSPGTFIHHIFGCVFSDAITTAGGGVIAIGSGGDLIMSDCLMQNNRATANGGCMSVNSHCLTFHRCVFKGNSAVRGGCITSSTLSLGVWEDCHFEENTATEGHHFSGNDIYTSVGTTAYHNSTLIVGCTSTSSAPKISFYQSATGNGAHPQAEILLPDPSTKTDYEQKLSVAVDGSGSTCSEALPCQTIEDALLTISTTGRNRILIGTGTFEDTTTRTVSGSVELVGNGWVRDSSFFTTVVSGGMKVGSGGNVTLRSMTLLPSTATTIVVEMEEEGVLRLSFVRIDEISSHSSSLISISKGTTTLFRCWFDKVNLTSSAFVSVSGSASLNVLGTYFMLITRTNGEGASCIDSESTGQLALDTSDFGNCSSSGVAGALHLKGITPLASLNFNQVYFFNNEAKTESTATGGTVLKAHDMIVEGFDSKNLSENNVKSTSPQISFLRLGQPTSLSFNRDFGYSNDGAGFPLAGKYTQGIPLSQFTSLKIMTEQVFRSGEIVSPILSGLTLTLEPLLAEYVHIEWRYGTIHPSTSSETLVTTGQNATFQFAFCSHIFTAVPTVTPFVVNHPSGFFDLFSGSLNFTCPTTNLPVPLFSLSTGQLRLINCIFNAVLSFSGCSMIEGTGGSVILTGGVFKQITSTGNGSVVHATSTIVNADGSKFEGCQSKNGGAIWFEATGTKYLRVSHPSSSTHSTTFENCEAAERGGAICVEGSSSISNPIRFFTDNINHARFSGNKATVSGNDVFVGKNVFGSRKISEIGLFGGGSLSDWFHVVIEDLGKTEEEKVDIGLLIPLPTVSVNGSVNELTTGMSGTDNDACKWTSTFCATLVYAMNSLRSKHDGKDIEMKAQFVWNMTYTELPMRVSDQNVKLTGTTAKDQTKCNETRTIVEMDSKSAAGSALFTIENQAVFSVSNMDLKIREGHGLFVVESTGNSLRIENCGMIASSDSTLSESVICVNGGSLELVSSLLNTTELPTCSLSVALISVNSATANVILDTVSISGFSFSSSSLVHLVTETSMTVKHVRFKRCVHSLGNGHLVLVEGNNFVEQISPANWEGTFSEDTPMDSLWGKDSTLSSSSEWNEASLLFYLFRPDGKIVAGGTGNKASTHPFCGSEQLICSTLESAHTSLRNGLDTVWIESDISLISKLRVATSATLTSSTSTKRVVWLTESGMIEVDGIGITVTMTSLTVSCDSSSISPTLFSVKSGTLDVDECVLGGSSSENALVLSSFVTSLISVGQAGVFDLRSSKISNVVFAHSSDGSAVVVEKGGSFVTDSSESVSSIRSNGTGSHLLMFGDSFGTIAGSAEMKKLKPGIPEIGFFSLEERKRLAGSVDGDVESILYEWHERESGVVHVRREGVDAAKGGHACLPQQTLSFCLTELVSGGKIVIDSAFSLAEALVQPNSEITISANPMKNEEIGVEVEVVELGSFSVSQGHLTVSSLSFSTAIKAGPFMTVSNTGSLTITSCSFSGFSSGSSGSVVSASLGDANTLSITSSKFSNCKSDLSGGVIHLILSSATESSQIEMKGTFSDCFCGNGKKGDWVFVEGTNLENQIDAQNWNGHPTTFGDENENRMWGTDSSESSPIFSSSTLLVYLLETTLDEVFVSSLGRDVRGCGLARWPCKTISSSTSHLLNSTTSQVTLHDASSLTEEVVNSWNHLIVCGDEQTSKDVLVSLSGRFSIPILKLSLSFIAFDTNEGCFATSLITLSGTGSLSVDSCSFRSFHSSSSGSIVCGTVSSSSFLSLTASSFSSCRSDGDGGVIWVRCEESVESSSLVVNCSFDTLCGCGSGSKGEWVFVEGFGFEDLISAPNWERTSSSLSSPTNDSLLFGVDRNEAESSSFHSLSLLYYLTEFRGSTIFVGSNGRDSNGCGHSERMCKRLERGHAHLKGTMSLELFVVETVSLTSVLTFAPNNLVITSQIGRGIVNVEGEGTLLQSGRCDMLDAVHNWSWTTDSDIVFIRKVGCV